MIRASRRRAAGFTLVELMISLVIIGIMAMAVAPSLSELLADNRQNAAAWDIVRLARRARAAATATGAAHLLVLRNSTNTVDQGNRMGAIWTFAGMNNKCAQTPWAQAAANALNPVERFDMFAYNPMRDSNTRPSLNDTDRQVIYFELRIGEAVDAHTAGFRICYQPNGEIFSAATGPSDLSTMLASDLAVQTTSLLVSVLRRVDGSARGVAGGRQVLFPVGGNARLR